MSTTAPWTLVARREMNVKLRDRNFIIGTVLTLVLLVGAIMLPVLIGGGGTAHEVAVTDTDGAQVVQQAEPVVQAADDETTVSVTEVADREAAESAVLDGDADAALVGGPGEWELLADGEPPGDLAGAITETVQATALAANAEAAGTSLDQLTEGSMLATVDLAAEAGGMPFFLQLILGLGFALLFYMAALTFGMQIAQSVVEEKQSRIVEILAAMIPVRQLLMGKVLGNTVIVFGQIALIAVVSLIGLTFIDVPFELTGIAEAIAWYVPFFVLGFLALACVWAAAGALASRNEDLQTTTLPLTMILVVLLILGFNATGIWREVLSYLPIASTFVMPVRIVEGEVGWWEPLVALAVVLVFCALTIVFGARLYERALMHTSGALSWRKAMSLKG